jgi:hypothetical protein
VSVSLRAFFSLLSVRWGQAVALAAALSFAGPLAAATGTPTVRFSAAVATEWFRLDVAALQQTPDQSPPVAARTLAYLGLGLYESVLGGMPEHRTLAEQLNELDSLPEVQPDEVLHWPTVANATLAALSRMLLANAPADWRVRIDTLERNMPLLHAEDFDPAARTQEVVIRSETYGKLLAMAIWTWARTDGGHDVGGQRRVRIDNTYLVPSGPGAWSPTPPKFARTLLPHWGENRTFMRGVSQACDPPGPPRYDEILDSPFYKEALEVYNVSGKASEAQRQIALYWADDPGKTPTPAGHWAFILTDLLKERKSNLAFTAEAYAKLGLAMSDAFVAAWHTKYSINLLRPVTYIQLTMDSNWTPTLMDTPPFPEYPSGHSVQSGAAAAVLSSLFGSGVTFVDRTHNDRGWGPRTFKSFEAAAQEAAISRMYAGIHFRSAIEHGLLQGRCIGAATLKLDFLRPVPRK